MNYQDSHMFQDIPDGKLEVLGQFYSQHQKAFVSWIKFTFSVSNEEAQDIFTEATLVVYEKIKSGKLTVDNMTAKLRTFLYSVGYNLCRDYKGRRERYEGVLRKIANKSDDFFNPHIAMEKQEEYNRNWNRLSRELMKLSVKQRQILHLYYFERKSHKEIAEIMGYANAESAKRAKHSCMQKLKRRIFKN